MGIRSSLALAAVGLLGALPAPASALAIVGASLAQGEVVSVIGLFSAPQPVVSGIAPAPYAESDQLLSLDLGSGTITADALTVNAASDVDGAPGTRSATAVVSVESLQIGGALSSLLTLSATTITSSSVATANGSVSASATVVLEGLAISVFGVPLVIPSDPAPNTFLYDAGGVRIFLNKQVPSGDGMSEAGIEVNALHIKFQDAALGLGSVTGDIVISHSHAMIGVPEPSLAALLAVAVGLVALRGWRAGPPH